MSLKAKKQPWVFNISYLSNIYLVPSLPGKWSFRPWGLLLHITFQLLSTIPVRALLSEVQQGKEKRVGTFTPIAWTEICKNLNQRYTIYAAFMQHSLLFYLPGLLGWMANMEENTLLSWCFAFCKRRSFALPTLVPNWATSTSFFRKDTSCNAVVLEKTILCYFIFGRKFVIFVQYWPAFKCYQTRLAQLTQTFLNYVANTTVA